MRLCAITDRKSLAPQNRESRPPDSDRELLRLISGWVRGGVDLIQLREKDLDTLALRRLAEKILAEIEGAGTSRRCARLIINLPLSSLALRDVAPVADGIHLPGPPLPGAADVVRKAFRAAGREAIVSLSCHTVEEVRAARQERADMVLFAPVFEKVLLTQEEKILLAQGEKIVLAQENRTALAGQGLGVLRGACEAAREMPVFALGGVTVENAAGCEAAGAAGVAGIRLFAKEGWQSLRAAPATEERPLPF